MSTLFRVEPSRPLRLASRTGAIADHTGQVSRYLTDGVTLYRFAGAVRSGMGEMVGLEDCRSLVVTWLPVGELRARRLRGVIPE